MLGQTLGNGGLARKDIWYFDVYIVVPACTWITRGFFFSQEICIIGIVLPNTAKEFDLTW